MPNVEIMIGDDSLGLVAALREPTGKARRVDERREEGGRRR